MYFFRAQKLLLSFVILLIPHLLIADSSLSKKSSIHLNVQNSWESSTYGPNAIYGCEDGVYRPLLGKLIYETPTPLHLIKKGMDLVPEFNNDDAKKIAAVCRSNFSNEFDLVSCLSYEVKKFFKDFKFTYWNSFCRSHSYAFDEAFKELKIPRSSSSTMTIRGTFGESCKEGGHVVNRFTIVSDSGQPYTYVVDAGWFPGKAFPLTQDTVNFHKTTKTLPDLHSEKPKNCGSKNTSSKLKEILKVLNF